MRVYQLEQGTPEWHSLRLGIPTASEFDKIITEVRGDYSKQATSYANALIAEILTRETMRELPYNKWLDRGSTMEADAADAYERIFSVKLHKVGLITNDAHTWGASLDRIIDGQKKAVEIKCPKASTLLDYYYGEKDLEKEYYNQVQGQIFVSDGEIEEIDLFAWCPDMPYVCKTIKRDEKRQNQLAKGLERFQNEMSAKLEKLIAEGHIKL
ncbi:MAG: YqaJ viral recombinase family protein [Saprospiraceae bacterium]|nr:YqaJ viral recombinase family protein [Saprospiraceae bacterium]